ncbi:MAG: LysR family transcriptional regulator [Pseudomonadota bacterium]|nr:LysR family transcriptional regulator [Pseudomonadota bacterium]
MDWDDYRYFTAVAARGSVRGAAQILGVNASTVMRRLDQLEESLGVSLFRRSPRGLAITTEGVEVAQRTDVIARQFRIMESTIKGRDQRVAGRIRIALPDVLASRLLLKDLAVFNQLYPDVDLELIPGYQSIDLDEAQADIVVRVTDSPPESMVGRRIGFVAFGAYTSGEFRRTHPDFDIKRGLPWVDWAGQGEVAAHYQTLRLQYFQDVKVAIRCDQIEMQLAAILAGIGMGVLPCFIGEPDSRLERLNNMPIQPGPEIWILTHPASRSVRRIQLFLAFLRDTLAGYKDVLEAGVDAHRSGPGNDQPLS